jgi:predicted secreted protein with PEFG-CTERM motif
LSINFFTTLNSVNLGVKLMKTHLSVFALSAILIVSIGMTSAFGQSSVVVTTDKASYSGGETIEVTGQVSQLLGGYALSLTVIAPNGNIVTIDQLTVGADSKFSTTVAAGGSLMKSEGTYTIKVQYGDNKNNSAETTFEFGGSTTTPPSKVTDTHVSVEGSSDLIGYTITGGKLISIVPDFDAKSLMITIESTENGSLTLEIPRSILDAVLENGEDDDFIILIDYEEAIDYDETTSPTHRTLTIEFPAGTEEIEIIGTFVVPEFGTIAAMILAVAIISIIAISAKSRLSIIPRY